tara:strand:+ start:1165 stop:2043 length:879 start_codon:yes stop_codon:yes gene_type:complete
MKGIVLAGGSGSRLYPLTKSLSKQLLPVYDKPMIYYPISILMLAGIKEILIISTPFDLPRFKELLGDGSRLGVKFNFLPQETPGGIAEALIIGNSFVGKDPVCLILGDNIMYGQGITSSLQEARSSVIKNGNAVIFGIKVNNPKSYGIAELNEDGMLISIEEKPKLPKSNNAIIGLYFYPNIALNYVKNIKPSSRGEKEITTLNQKFLKKLKLSYTQLGRGAIWFDAGTPESLKASGDFIHSIQKRQGNRIACLEEIALNQGFISKEDLLIEMNKIGNNEYSSYIYNLISKI